MSDGADHMLKHAIDAELRDVPGFRSVMTRCEAIEIARRVLALFPVTAAALFGSFARDEQTDRSDLDFLVSFSRSSRVGDVEEVRDALEYATGRGVDVVTSLEGQTSEFRASAMRDGVRLLG